MTIKGCITPPKFVDDLLCQVGFIDAFNFQVAPNYSVAADPDLELRGWGVGGGVWLVVLLAPPGFLPSAIFVFPTVISLKYGVNLYLYQGYQLFNTTLPWHNGYDWWVNDWAKNLV